MDKDTRGRVDGMAGDKSTGDDNNNTPSAKTPKLDGGVPSKPARKAKKARRGGKRAIKKPKKEVKQEVSAEVKKEEKPKTPQKVINLALSDKQQTALAATEKFVLYGGAKGGGKSWFLCIWTFLKAIQNKGNKIFFCRKRAVDFNNTTLETWKKAIPAEYYRINEQKKKIFIDAAKSVIDYGGLDDPQLVQSLNSAEFAHIAVDQAEEIGRDQFGMLIGTLRHKLPSGEDPKRQIMMTANPAQCWLKDYFLLNPQPNTQFIQALPTDNPELPEDYVENLKLAYKHRPALLEAYLNGSWDDLSANDTCIRGSWIEEAKKKNPKGQVLKRIIVNDPAITGDENVCFLMELRGNTFCIADELIIEHNRPIESAAKIAAFRKLNKAQIIAIDSIGVGQGVIAGLNQLEEPILPINSSSKPTVQHNQLKYANLRAQLWWEAAEKFADGRVALPSDDFELAKQLGQVRFEPSGTGKLLVEGKDEIKKALGRSPDRADAFVMGLYALDYVDRLDQQEFDIRSQDRVGHGILITPYYEEDTMVAVGEDYSGYNL